MKIELKFLGENGIKSDMIASSFSAQRERETWAMYVQQVVTIFLNLKTLQV